MGWYEGSIWRWTLAWSRELNLDDQRQLVKLQDLLQLHYPSRQHADKIQWCQRSKFSTTELVSKASQLTHDPAAVDNLASTVWKNIAPPKVEFMVWLALLGKLNTREMLVKKNVIPPEANQCSFCLNHPETIDHVLLSCPFSWGVWSSIAEDLGLRLINHHCLRQFYDWWMSRRFPNTLRKRLHILVFFATAWSLWSKRNLVIFQDHDYDQSTLCHTIQWRVALWTKMWKENIPYSTEELVRQFNSIPLLFS